MISVIVPVRDEEALAAELAVRLLRLQTQGMDVIVVDGGSRDRTADILERAGLPVRRSPPGRARQMNVGAGQAAGDILLFLHADTVLPADAVTAIEHGLARDGRQWGRFDVTIAGQSRWLPLVAFLMNWRSRLTGIATGDQAIFLMRQAFDDIGRFPLQPLMEDIEASRRLLRRVGPPACLRQRVITSGRRWDSRGAWPTILLMWRLRWAYWRGVPAESLAELYR